MGVLDFIYPKRCVVCKKLGNYICENCFVKLSFDASSLCLVCDKPSFNNLTHPICRKKYTIDGCFSAISYNKIVQKLIYSFKYKPYLSDLENTLTELFYESIIQNENFQKLIADGGWFMVPIPLSEVKLRKRGYNQSEILAKALSKKFKNQTYNLLKRIRDTKTQFKLSKNDREKNMKGIFAIVKSKSSILNQNIFLVDDIVTTGATLKEAAKALKRNGAKKVFGLTLARD